MLNQGQQQSELFGRKPPPPFNLKLRMEEFERGYLQNTLQLMRWDLKETARLLGITQEALRQKITAYELESKKNSGRNSCFDRQ